MKILILSDIHIGDPRLKNEDDIISLLNNTDFDELILNGDIIDQWILGYKKIVLKSKIISTIENIAANKRAIWIVGNHDCVSVPQTFIKGVQICDYYWTENCLFIHGHQVYFLQNKSMWSKILANINFIVYKLFGLDIQGSIHKTRIYKNSVKSKREKIINKYGHLAKTIIIGHTHIPAYQNKDGIKLYDSGTILNGNYIILEGNTIKQLSL